MRRAMSTYVFVKQRLHPGLLDTMVRGGAEAIEVFGARDHFDYTNAGHVREIAAWFKTSGVELNSLHAPMYSDYEWGRTGKPPVTIVDVEKRRRVESMDEIKRALEVAEQVPFRFLVQHLGVGGEEFTDKKFEAAMTSVEHLRAFAKPLGVQIVLENIPNEIAVPEKLVELINVLHFDDLGLCFDSGHAHVMSSVGEAFAVMKPHVRTTHIHDNNKERDEHLWPGKGSINWSETMAAVAEAPHVPPVLMEIGGEEGVDVAASMNEAYRLMEKAAADHRPSTVGREEFGS